METGVKELTEKYRKRFEAFYHTEGSNTDRKGSRRKRTEESPSFLKEVIHSILDTLPELLPSMVLSKPRVIAVLKHALSLLVDFL